MVGHLQITSDCASCLQLDVLKDWFPFTNGGWLVGRQTTISRTETVSKLFYHSDIDSALSSTWLSFGSRTSPVWIPSLLHTYALLSSGLVLLSWHFFLFGHPVCLLSVRSYTQTSSSPWHSVGTFISCFIFRPHIYRRLRIDLLSHSWKQVHYTFDLLSNIAAIPDRCWHVDLLLVGQSVL